MAIDGGSVEVRFEGDVTPLRRSVDEAVDSISELEVAAGKADEALGSILGQNAVKGFERLSTKAGETFSTLIDKADAGASSIKALGESLKGVGFATLTAGATAATGALANLAKKGIQSADFLESSRIAMAGLTGSMQEGNKAMSEAAKFWQNNPFQRIDVTNATKQLVQFGRSTNNIASDLSMLGDVSLSTGMNIGDLARYYARVSASGRAMTMDLEMMSDRGVPIYRELGKALNTTTAGVREMASKGKIDFETFRKAMEGAVSAEAMEEYENTLARQMDRFKGSIQIIAGEMAGYKIINDELVISEQGLEKAWTRLMKALATGLRSDAMKKGLEGIGYALASIVDKITKLVEPALNMLAKALQFIGDNSELLVPILGAIAVAIGKLGSSIPFVSRIMTALGGGKLGGIIANVKEFIRLNPLLTATIGILALGFFDAMKNSEEFRATFGSIVKSLSQILSNLMEAFRGVFAVVAEIVKTLADSGVVQGVLQAVASALAWIAQAIASIPPEMLATLISFFLSLKLIKANPLYLLAAGLAILISRIKELGGIGKIFENLPQTLSTIGHNLMTGLINGIQEGAQKVFNYIKDVAKTIVSTFKNMLGIHSPSTVMYGLGQDVVLGLANGIEDSKSAIQIAMNNLAKDILSVSEKVIKNKVDFGVLDIKGEYQQWKKVSRLFTVGSEQYNTAIERMEEARKQANLKILELQRSYNDALDETIDKIAGMYGLLDDVNLKAGKNAQQILKGLDQQVAKLSEWAEAQEIIANSKLDAGLIEELQAMGVESTSELSAIANMTADELSTLNNMWLKKQAIANRAGVKQMEGLKNDTLNQINDLKKGIDGVTVDVEDVGGRLVSHISEGVYGAMPTLESAFSQLGKYIEKAQRELAKTASGAGSGSGLGGSPTADVPNAGEEITKSLKEDIQNGLNKVKDMLPNILLGAIGAWGVAKFGPKVLSKFFAWVSKGLVNGPFNGSTIVQGISGSLGKSSELGFGLRKALYTVIDDIPYEEHTATGKILEKFRKALGPKQVEEPIKETAKSLKNASKPAQTIAESTTSISQSVGTASQGMSKVDKFLGTIIKGGVAIIAIAGAIAAMAGALWLTYNALKDVDFKKLAEQIGMMAVAVGVFGVLAGVIGRLPTAVLVKGVLVVIGIAADIALLSLAIKSAYETMKDIPWDGFGSMLGMMASAIGAFGLLNGVLGIGPIAIAEGLGLLVSAGIIVEIVLVSKACREAYETMKGIPWDGFGNMIGQMAAALGTMSALNAPLGALIALEALGWASVMLICDELVKVAKALKVVEKNVPENFNSLEKKLQHIKRTLEIINGLDLGTVIGMMVTSWSADPAERIVTMYVRVAEALNKLSKIELDKAKIEASLDYIKGTLESIKAKTDLISGWLEASRLDIEASSVENAGRIVIVYADMVDALDKLANFEPNEAGISKSLVTMAGVITLLRNQTYGPVGIFNIFNNMDTIANDVDKIKGIVKNYLEMVPTIQDLGKTENQISDDLTTTVTKNIKNIKAIVLEIGSVDTGGWIDQKESDMGKIQSLLNKFTELEPVIWQVANFNLSYLEGDNSAKAKIRKIKEIVLEIGSVDTGGWIDQKESDMNKIQSILNKFTEVAKTCGLLSQYPVSDDAQSWIQKVRHLVWEIGQINQGDAGSLDAKAEIIEKSKTIAKKLGEFGEIVNSLKAPNEGDVVHALTSTLNSMLDGVANSMNQKIAVFENVGVNIGTKLAHGAQMQAFQMQQAGLMLQSSLWSAIESKMGDEFQQGAWMATQFGNGLKSVDISNVGAAMQTSLWWGIQNRMNDEYWQGRAMGERFRQGLYDIDYGNAGWWAVQGFINGAWGKAGSGDGVYHTGWWIADRFLRGLKDRGNQGSPWKTTMESGNWAVEGLIQGMQEQETALVNEATTLADQVIDALTMENMTMTPTLDASVNGNLAPSMGSGEYGIIGGNGRGVVVEQTNNNYTEYDLERINRDLAWQLSKA